MTRDPVQDRLLEIIAAKKKGRPPSKSKAEADATPSNVINIMDALRKSIGAETKPKKRR